MKIDSKELEKTLTHYLKHGNFDHEFTSIQQELINGAYELLRVVSKEVPQDELNVKANLFWKSFYSLERLYEPKIDS